MKPLLLAASLVFCSALPAFGQTPPTDSTASTKAATTTPSPEAARKSVDLDVPASALWLDTNLDVYPGEQLEFTASGSATYPAVNENAKDQTFGPGGLARSWRDLIHQYPVADSGHGALVARIGGPDSGSQPFAVGASQKTEISVPGRLFLGINQGTREAATASGSFRVTIKVLGTAPARVGAAFLPDQAVAGVSAGLLAKIPRRVSDRAGHPGDMVNVLIIGSPDQLTAVFKAAGWVEVDKSVGDAILAGALATLQKDAYLTMPMSMLFLFGRAQDYGFAHAEPVKVVESRNHLRAWKSPYEVDSRPVWCIAATHDIGFERDQRNNGLTHKIDPAVDGEREYVNHTLSSTGLVRQRDHRAPPNALTSAKTATGGEFHSDGRLLILVLTDAGGSTK